MSLETVSQYYEEHHQRKGKVGTEFMVNATRAKYFQQWIGTGKQVLDIGCRDGELTQNYLKGNEVTGLDCDRNALAIAQQRGISTQLADLNAPLGFPDATFEAVVAGEVLEHLFAPPQVVAEIARVLKPGGVFAGSVPNGYRFKNRRRFLMGRDFDVHPFSEHLHIFSWRHIEALLRPYFTEIEIVPLEGKILWPLEVTARTPRRVGYFFSLSLAFRGTRSSNSA